MLYIPSLSVVEEIPAPLSTERNTLDKPEVESEPMAVIVAGETYQPFDPLAAIMSKLRAGETVSTFAEKVPICELSPHEDNAQKEKIVSAFVQRRNAIVS